MRILGKIKNIFSVKQADSGKRNFLMLAGTSLLVAIGYASYRTYSKIFGEQNISSESSETENITSQVTGKGHTLYTDIINERTSAAGVTIDGVLIKDGLVDGVDLSTHTH